MSKFLGLLDRGWDVHIACQESASAQWDNFPELARHPEARRRVHVGWPHRPLWWAVLLLPCALLHCLWRNPGGTWRYGRAALRRFGSGALRHIYLDATLLAWRPEIVHYEFGALAVGRMYLKELLHCKVTVSFRGYDLNLVGLEKTDHLHEVCEKVDAIHLLGESLWRRAQERGCRPAKPHALIPPAVDPTYFQAGARGGRDGTAERPLRVVSVGRLTWEKGYDYAIEAIAALVRRGIHAELRIVGDGPLLESMAFARHQLGATSAVHFLGGLPKSAVRIEMLNADVLLHASVSEGFGNAVIEAQAMGLPVVCTDAGGLPENVLDGETGFVVHRRNASALADKLAALASDPLLREQMGKAGQQRVRSNFLLASQIEAFDRFYHDVFGEGSKEVVA